MAAGAIAVAATMALGVAGAAAAPNPGQGTPGFPIVTGTNNTAPLLNAPYEQSEDGPQTANIPTLAWVGEDVRLVACDDVIAPDPLGNGVHVQQASWSSGDNGNLWTGDQAVPPVFDGSQSTNLYVTNTGSAFFFYPNGLNNDGKKGCVSADIHSLHAGLDEVTLNVTDEGTNGGPPKIGNSVVDPGITVDPTVVYSEQFIVIWMTANQPKITEASTQSLSFPTSAAGELTAPTSQLTTLGLKNLASFIGDPSGNGVFAGLDAWGADSPCDGPMNSCANDANMTPTANNGLVQVRVTGSFPIEDQPPATTNANYFAPITGGGNPSSITLPNQWKALATLMAASSTNYQGTNASLWDIHGSPTNTLAVQGHAGNGPASAGPPPKSAGVCQYDGTLFNQTTDVVDDCASTGGTTPTGNPWVFSRVFGDMTASGPEHTIGPFDAQDPSTTLLSDGSLNSDDAPMPALPVTLSIAKGGLGGLYGVSKWLIYSHDFDGSGASPLSSPTSTSALTSTGTANLYNPYYQEYIPSTLRPINEASGIIGVYAGGGPATSGDNFPGFSDGSTDPYTFWKALSATTTDSTPVSNGCLEYDTNVDGTSQDFFKQNPPQIVGTSSYVGKDGKTYQVPNGLFYYGTPDYPTSVIVYTDERGEAYVDYNPGTGWYNSINPDGNGACDLQGLYGKALGTSVITAQAQYPYESVPYPAIPASASLTKTVDSEWSKTLSVYPKGNLGGNNISVVVAHAQNVNGEPFSGEEVCVQAPANESVTWDDENPLTVTTPPIDTTGSKGDADNLSNNTCGWTGTAGNVAFDVSGSLSPSNVDVQALFVPEHIWRDVIIPVLGQTTTVSSSPPGALPGDPVTPVVNAGSLGSVASSGAGSTPPAAGPSSTPSTTPLVQGAHVAHVTLARLVHNKKGTFLKLNVSSSNATATLTITVRGKNHKTRILHVTVKTNKTVSISLGSAKVVSYKVTAH